MNKTFIHYLVLCALLMACLLFYTLSFQLGTFLLLIVGACFECYFWYKLFSGKGKKDYKNENTYYNPTNHNANY